MFGKVCVQCGGGFEVQWSRNPQKYCSLACYAAAREVTPYVFWSRVNKTDACWLWTAGKDSKGYGAATFQGKNVAASRFAWMLTYGSIPSGMNVLHRCDVPACVRPDHLFLGTTLDNMQDKVAKGRQAHNSGDKNGARLHPEAMRRGQEHGNAKLTTEQVVEIRRLRGAEGLFYKTLGLQFGVSESTIHLICTGRHWRHVGAA
jgi:hypothetical protein